MRNWIRNACFTLCIITTLMLRAHGADPQSWDDLDHPMYTDPDLTIPAPIHMFDERYPKLWTSALSAPESDARRRSAESMGFASRMGMQGLELAIPKLIELANQEQEEPLVRRAALRALVAMNAEGAAEAVWRTALQLGADAEADAITALARWKHEPAREVWRQRVASSTAGCREMLLAIQGLMALEDESQNDSLEKLVSDEFATFDIRLAAARALAALERSGMEPLAEKLLANEAPRRERLLAATLMRHHSGAAGEDLLERLSLDTQPAIAALALERLVEIAPGRVMKHHAELLASRDTKVRRWAVQSLAHFPSSEHTAVLAQVTHDPHPGNRVLARDILLTFAKEHNLRDAVLQEADKLISEKDWRGIEQGCRLIGYLDHKSSGQALVEVLPHPRTEAHATAAWALRKLAVPETLPQILSFASTVTDRAMPEFRTGSPQRDYDPLFTQIFQFFGEVRYQPADPLLRRYIPKLSMSVPSRCAAIWALGYLHQDHAPADLVTALEARILDVGVPLPEMERVRGFCAVSLGRMKAKAALPTLERFYGEDGPYTPSGYGCGWAIEQMTGQVVEKPIAPFDYEQGFFLLPIK